MSKTFVFDKHANHDLLRLPFLCQSMEFGQEKKRRAEAAVKRSPARKRARRGTEPTRTQAQLAESRASSMAKLVGTAQLRRRASHLGAQEPEQAPRVDRAQRPSWQHNHDAERMSQRLKAGRTVDICMQLMAFNLLSPITTAENKLQLRAAKGLSAKKRSVPHQNFFIIDVFHRRGVPLVDIAPLTPKEKDEPGALFFLGAIQTVKQENLWEISFRFRPTSIQISVSGCGAGQRHSATLWVAKPSSKGCRIATKRAKHMVCSTSPRSTPTSCSAAFIRHCALFIPPRPQYAASSRQRRGQIRFAFANSNTHGNQTPSMSHMQWACDWWGKQCTLFFPHGRRHPASG